MCSFSVCVYKAKSQQRRTKQSTSHSETEAHETMVVAVVALDHLYIIVALFRKPDENRRKVEERDAKKMKRKMRSARQKEKLTSYGRENFLTKLLAPMNFLPDTTTAAAVAECNFPWNFSRAKKRNKNKRKKNKLRAIQFEWEMSFVYATRIKQQQEWKWWWQRRQSHHFRRKWQQNYKHIALAAWTAQSKCTA